MANNAAGRGQGRGALRPRWASLLHGPDLRNAVVILVVCAVLFYVTTTFDSVPEFLSQNIQASWFPRVMLITIALLALILPVEHLFMESGREGLDEERKARVEPISMLTALLLCAVVGSMLLFGTYGAITLVSLALPLLWGERLSVKLLVFVVAFPAAVTFVFTQLLKVYFEPGLLGHWLR